jgi:hypothetical protein
MNGAGISISIANVATTVGVRFINTSKDEVANIPLLTVAQRFPSTESMDYWHQTSIFYL